MPQIFDDVPRVWRNALKAEEWRLFAMRQMYADALELAAIGKAYFRTGKTHDQIAGQDRTRDGAVAR
jgi:hypothetical protein